MGRYEEWRQAKCVWGEFFFVGMISVLNRLAYSAPRGTGARLSLSKLSAGRFGMIILLLLATVWNPL